MKGFAMLRIGEVGWIEKDRPVCGPNDAICRPLAIAICTSDVHTVWEGAVGERHNMILGHEGCAEVTVLPVHSKWYGVTYREDHEKVAAAMAALTADGLYPEKLK